MSEMQGACGICEVKGTVFHLPLYVNGSEGIWVCLKCRVSLTDIVRSMQMAISAARLRFVVNKKGG